MLCTNLAISLTLLDISAAISGVDRKGRAYQFPLVSLSIGVVNNQFRHPHNLDEISTLVADAKRHAKQSSDNVFSISSPLGIQYQDHSHMSVSEMPPVLSLMNMQHVKRSTKQDVFVEFY